MPIGVPATTAGHARSAAILEAAGPLATRLFSGRAARCIRAIRPAPAHEPAQQCAR
jgi:hypothetical protein